MEEIGNCGDHSLSACLIFLHLVLPVEQPHNGSVCAEVDNLQSCIQEDSLEGDYVTRHAENMVPGSFPVGGNARRMERPKGNT